MNRKLKIAAAFFLASAAITPAQVGAIKVKVRIPFEFGIANQTLPAGQYTVGSERDELYLRSAEGKTVAMVQSNRVTHDGGKFGKVVFNCYEKRCFLSQLWMPDTQQGHELLMSKTEKEVAKKTQALQLALLGEGQESRPRN